MDKLVGSQSGVRSLKQLTVVSASHIKPVFRVHHNVVLDLLPVIIRKGGTVRDGFGSSLSEPPTPLGSGGAVAAAACEETHVK